MKQIELKWVWVKLDVNQPLLDYLITIFLANTGLFITSFTCCQLHLASGQPWHMWVISFKSSLQFFINNYIYKLPIFKIQAATA